ncbi:MAG: energy transducer TonB [Chthoniobacterales bacterium]
MTPTRQAGKSIARLRLLRYVLSLIFAFTACAPAQPTATPSGHSQKATGVFLLDFDYATGAVTDVRVLKSTGSPILDATSIRTFKRWRCKPGAYRHVKVPITYTMTGAHP